MSAQRVDDASRLAALAGAAPRRSPNVRTLARFAANSKCALASLGFAAQVDFDKLLVKTRFEVPFGQSPFAFRRGNLFEDTLRKDDYLPMRQLLASELGGDPKDAKVINLRLGYPKSREGMAQRADATRGIIARILADAADAPNLIDGAVLQRRVGGVLAHFEADAVAAQFGSPILAGEIKSFPTVDGQADPDKVGAAISQVAIYVLLLRELVEELGGDAARVSGRALLITPKNTGLQPTLTSKEIGREVDRASRILSDAPRAVDIAAALPTELPSFEVVASAKLSEDQRVDAASQLADAVGTCYGPGCLSSCGMSRLCRERAYASGSPTRIGGSLVRLLPGITSLDRAGQLADGATPSVDEVPVAHELTRAAELLDTITEPGVPNKRKRTRR